MDFSKVDRRVALGLLGGLVPGLALTRGAQATPSSPSSSRAATAAPAAARAAEPATEAFEGPAPSALLGLVAGPYRVIEASPIQQGAFVLRLANEQGDSFRVDVCALDDAADAPRGPARTPHLELFLANEGDGRSPTHEAHGLAVMALVGPLGQREHLIPVARMLPLRERLRRFGDRLGR